MLSIRKTNDKLFFDSSRVFIQKTVIFIYLNSES